MHSLSFSDYPLKMPMAWVIYGNGGFVLMRPYSNLHTNQSWSHAIPFLNHRSVYRGPLNWIFQLQIPTEVLSHPVVGQDFSNNLSYNQSILFKIVLFESLSIVDYNHMICFEFIVIQTFLDSNNARNIRFCQDKSLVVCRMKGTRDRQTFV